MSSVSFVTTTQPSIPVTAGKSTASQTVATSMFQTSVDTSSVAISQAARDALAAANAGDSAIPADSNPQFKQGMAEKFAGGNAQRAIFQNDPSNPLWAKAADAAAQHAFNVSTDVLYDISHTMQGASGNPTIDGILRYSSGETVTVESQAYATQQGKSYQNQVLQLYSSEMAKKTPPGDILIKMMDLQGQQPARFRAMSEWPIAADFTNNQAVATSGGLKA